jgi:hypothetical protein
MDYFSEDSAHVTNGLSLNEPAASTCEDRITRKRWTRAVLAFYACVFLAGATAITVHQNFTSSSGTEPQVSLQTDVRSNH